MHTHLTNLILYLQSTQVQETLYIVYMYITLTCYIHTTHTYM